MALQPTETSEAISAKYETLNKSKTILNPFHLRNG